MSEEWESLLTELRKIPRGSDSAPQYLRHIMRLFVADFEQSMSKRLDVKFWKKLKTLIDEMRKASENDRLVETNVFNLAVGFVLDLGHLVQQNYALHEYALPDFVTIPAVFGQRKPVKSRKNSRVFLAYFMLRLGDITRYKNDIRKAREYYEISARINPADGAVWNQLGICAAMSAKWLESVYFHTRAIHATIPFDQGTQSLAAIYNKFANRDITKPMPINDLFLACLSKIHFLMEIKDSHKILGNLGKTAATSKEMIVPIMSLYQHLEGDTELENRAVGYVRTVWQAAYRNLLEEVLQNPTDDDLIHILALLRTAPEFVHDPENYEHIMVANSISTHSDENVKDSHGFAHFVCAENRILHYPISRNQLAKHLYGQIEQNEANIEMSSSASKNYDEHREKEVEEDVRNEHKIEESDSEEEILQRGRRRGRAEHNDESIDTDDDDF
ncbi:unnamed protein product [Caenorhabditis sp. 36 PRJEB53466]|nr:unnamed protein product [Caenorhabditis sp. 36 PRJEB53466]